MKRKRKPITVQDCLDMRDLYVDPDITLKDVAKFGKVSRATVSLLKKYHWNLDDFRDHLRLVSARNRSRARLPKKYRGVLDLFISEPIVEKLLGKRWK